jgi:hypothetical protein
MARKPNQNKTNAARIAAQEKRQRAVTARRMGLSYAQIAHQIGISKSAAYKAVQKALTDVQSEIDAAALLLRAQEMDRLDAMQAAAWPAAIKGEGSAIRDVLRVMERRAKMTGLDAPIKTAATTAAGDDIADMTAEERRERIKVLEGRRHAAKPE